VEVTVRAVRPGDGAAAPASDRPTAADSTASPQIQSDEPAVVDLAREVLPGETDAWTLACALERQVKQKVRLKNYSTAMASAAAVAKSLEGDCTEHAMLLAALCRARKIPARVALGLVYYAPGRAFAYHMWTEVWIGDRWIPLDATLGLGGIGAAHLKIASTSMSGAQAHGDLLPILSALGQLRLEVVAVE
jgi:transglutaminase-like putative cysteine protease